MYVSLCVYICILNLFMEVNIFTLLLKNSVRNLLKKMKIPFQKFIPIEIFISTVIYIISIIRLSFITCIIRIPYIRCLFISLSIYVNIKNNSYFFNIS